MEPPCPASQSAPQRLPTRTGYAYHDALYLRDAVWLANRSGHTADISTARTKTF